MKRLFVVITIILSVFCISETYAQKLKSQSIKPRWIHKTPKSSNNTFEYQVDHVIAQNLDEARDKSLTGLIAISGLENGVVVISDYKSQIVDSQVFVDGKPEDVQYEKFEVNSEISGEEQSLHIKRISEYWEQDKLGVYHLTTLYAKSMPNQDPMFDNVATTTKYGARGLWRSMIIPGWGQFHKGSNLKGGLMLGGTAALATVVIYTEGQRSYYNKRMFQTYDVDMIKQYQLQRDNFATARNIGIGAAVALYLYNIIDAIVAPGAERVVVKSNKIQKLAFAPTLTSEGYAILTANFKF